MASIDKVKAGQILHDYRKVTTSDGAVIGESHFLIEVKEVDLDHRCVLISWDGNTPRWVGEHSIEKYRINPKNPASAEKR